MLENLDKDTVDFVPNFDNTKTEPFILSGLICNLLINGCSGIAVGMACNLIPHNLNEVYDALNYYIDRTIANENIDIEDILNIIKGPDFPLGGTIVNSRGIHDYMLTGNGSITVRSDYTIETTKDGKESIVFNNIPYRTNKAEIVKNIDNLRINNTISEIKEVRDESSKDKYVRIVIELKKNANKDVVINKLYANTKLQSNISINNTVLVDGRQPIVANIDTIITSFLSHSVQVTLNYLTYEDNKVVNRLNIVNGILKAIQNIDTVVDIIKTSENEFDAIKALNIFDNDDQIKAILEMSIKTISRTNNKKYEEEFKSLSAKHDEYTILLTDQNELLKYIKNKFEAIKKKFGDERRTQISEIEIRDIDDSELIDDEDVVISYSNNDIIKCVSADDYRSQKRNGVGFTQYINEAENDSIKQILVTCNKQTLLFFTNYGRCHTIRAYKINKTSRNAKGKHINNYLNLDAGEQVIKMLHIDIKDKENKCLVMITKAGMLKKLSFDNLPKSSVPVRIISFIDNDSLVDVNVADNDDKLFIVSASGKALATSLSKVRASGRTSRGVNSMKLKGNDKIVKIAIAGKSNENDCLFTITENGFAKCTQQSLFKEKGKRGYGVNAHNTSDTDSKEVGQVVSAIVVDKNNNDLFISTRNGNMIRIDIASIKTAGRLARGVKAIKLNELDTVVSIATLSVDTEEDLNDTESVVANVQ